mgnify:CR=1 FL=1
MNYAGMTVSEVETTIYAMGGDTVPRAAFDALLSAMDADIAELTAAEDATDARIVGLEVARSDALLRSVAANDQLARLRNQLRDVIRALDKAGLADVAESVESIHMGVFQVERALLP